MQTGLEWWFGAAMSGREQNRTAYSLCQVLAECVVVGEVPLGQQALSTQVGVVGRHGQQLLQEFGGKVQQAAAVLA
jgi:hypothetical protein